MSQTSPDCAVLSQPKPLRPNLETFFANRSPLQVLPWSQLLDGDSVKHMASAASGALRARRRAGGEDRAGQRRQDGERAAHRGAGYASWRFQPFSSACASLSLVLTWVPGGSRCCNFLQCFFPVSTRTCAAKCQHLCTVQQERGKLCGSSCFASASLVFYCRVVSSFRVPSLRLFKEGNH